MSIRHEGSGGPASRSISVRVKLVPGAANPDFVLHPNDLNRVELLDDELKSKIRAELLKMEANNEHFDLAREDDEIDESTIVRLPEFEEYSVHKQPAQIEKKDNEVLINEQPTQIVKKDEEVLVHEQPAQNEKMDEELLTYEPPAQIEKKDNEELVHEPPAQIEKKDNEELVHEQPAQIEKKDNEALALEQLAKIEENDNEEALTHEQPAQIEEKDEDTAFFDKFLTSRSLEYAMDQDAEKPSHDSSIAVAGDSIENNQSSSNFLAPTTPAVDKETPNSSKCDKEPMKVDEDADIQREIQKEHLRALKLQNVKTQLEIRRMATEMNITEEELKQLGFPQ